jgi:DNA-binding XRE family transcriptional regulator
MAKLPKINFDHSANEMILGRYLGVTSPKFTPEMGKRLLDTRKEMNLTQRQLAEPLGLNQSDVCRLEGGKNIVAMPTCEKFKSVLGKRFQRFLLKDGFYLEHEINVGYHKQTGKHWGSKAR